MSLFDILAWLVLVYRDKFENNATILNQLRFVISFSFYKFYRFVYFYYNGGLNRIDILNGGGITGEGLRSLLCNVFAHSQLDGSAGSGLGGPVPNEKSTPDNTLDLSKLLLLKINSSCNELLELSLEPTTWEGNEKKYIQMYDSVFKEEKDEGIDESLVNELRYRKTTPTSNTADTGTSAPPPNYNSRANINWVALGFQGSDPSSDFRGSGQFGLECFYQFCTKNHPGLVSKTIMQQSGSFQLKTADISKPWYSVALVSIHLSQFLLTLFNRPSFKPAIFKGIVNSSLSSEDLKNPSSSAISSSIYSLHSILLIKFHNQWLKSVATGEVKSVMDTESFLQKFQSNIQSYLWKGVWNDSNDIYEILEN